LQILFTLNFHHLSLDIWGNNINSSQSIGVNGITQKIGGICSETKYSVIEWNGFAQIQNAAHELGHRYFQLENYWINIFKNRIYSLGAVHDGQKYETTDATSCPSNRNIMTPTFGSSPNPDTHLSFSKCSIDAFKENLLTSDKL
jgi:hypothetical protein